MTAVLGVGSWASGGARTGQARCTGRSRAADERLFHRASRDRPTQPAPAQPRYPSPLMRES
eukprot:9975158-Alexandrium_andersonii.AAC.1